MRKEHVKKGFSIGEVMIAMFILLVGIIDAVFLTVRSVDDLGDSRDAVVASLLAQEGTELVRNIRDNTVTQTTCGTGDDERCTAFDIEYGFPSSDQTGSSYCVVDKDLSGSTLMDCGGIAPSELTVDPNNFFFTQASGGGTYKGFARRIYMEYGYTDSDGGADSDGGIIAGADDIDEKYVDVTSVVVYSGGDFSDVTVSDVEGTCRKSKGCAYAQTRLTSWINYGD